MRTPRSLLLPLAGLVALLLLSACADRPAPEESFANAAIVDTAAAAVIDTSGLARHTKALSSDTFGGRGPASPGEDSTVAYLTRQFRQMGLEPAGDSGFVQRVPLVSITATGTSPLTVTGGGAPSSFAYGDAYMAWTKRLAPSVTLEPSEMVFVGYGIVAPEQGWDDYEGVDAEGKTVVMLVNDPGFATGDSALFSGEEMTYYGRWTYKYEEAARQGAEAALIVHEAAPAGYPWEVVRGSWSGPQFDLVRPEAERGSAPGVRPDSGAARALVEGWLTHDVATQIFDEAGLNYDALKAQAARPDFQAQPLGNLRASLQLQNRIQRTASQNVIARLPGAERPEECVLYMAHWDHLGRDTTRSGDQIFNGALDNATGTAGLLELAQAFEAMETPPERSVLFAAVTAEEAGLLGSAYYVEHPTCPLAQTAAVINMDGLNVLGPMNDLTVIGYGQSELDDYLAEAAATKDRTLRPDPEPEKGFYFRSDHFNFAKQGVPALYTDTGVESVEHGEEWARAQRDAYTTERYHKVTDEYDPSWNLEGAADDLRLLFAVGARLAGETTFPEWSAGSAFRDEQEALRQQADSAAAGARP